MIRSAAASLLFYIALFTLGAIVGGCSVDSGAQRLEPETTAASSSESDLSFLTPVNILIHSAIKRMDTPQLVGQMIMVSLETDESGYPVTTLRGNSRDVLDAVTPGGVILFGANLASAGQVQQLVEELQAASVVPLIVATDHEGGNVSRLTASDQMRATVMPSATLVGIAANVLVGREERSQAAELARQWGHVLGSELRALGITMNLAPVADVDTPGNPGVLATQRRTFGSDPLLVGELVAASIAGMHSAGVTAVLKHFPGQGAATLDSHTTSVALDHTRDQLDRALVPFTSGIDAGARVIMSAHISYPAVTGNNEPATTSKALITTLLREELGFDGVVMTDALNMDAVALGREERDLALAAINAGADIMLKPVDPVGLHAALVDAANSGIVSRERIELSVRRILQVKLQAGLFGPAIRWTEPAAVELLGSAAHREVVDVIRSTARSGAIK